MLIDIALDFALREISCDIIIILSQWYYITIYRSYRARFYGQTIPNVRNIIRLNHKNPHLTYCHYYYFYYYCSLHVRVFCRVPIFFFYSEHLYNTTLMTILLYESLAWYALLCCRSDDDNKYSMAVDRPRETP